jgi:hypothetical protein
VNLESYQAWLAERGIESPPSQPFVILASNVRIHAKLWLVAATDKADLDVVKLAMSRLGAAVENLGGEISWAVVDAGGELPGTAILRTLSPSVEEVIYLGARASDELKSLEPVEVDATGARVSHEPGITEMNQNPDLKKHFWERLKSKIQELSAPLS